MGGSRSGHPSASTIIFVSCPLVTLFWGAGLPLLFPAVRIGEPMTRPPAGRLPAWLNRIVLSELAAANAALVRGARRDVDAAASRLRRAGWRVRGEVRTGTPLAGLLDMLDRTHGDVLVVGARAARGLRRRLLGSVAAGALDRSPAPVLVAR